ncbi:MULTISPECIES: Hsp20/alpha crystallin family protein [Clostridiaceae]|uniref:Hsp20/alpha crystallin family protein n=1 Tax=Clostridium facile TaxID=2763035 RepID=A0ABR7ITD6_9CLOT|nr:MULTISPECIES: Hsp20/alpha crystallin family protein [Clostridiaceae]MBC5788406.1 Hsp20/alpha crystallin family protein [Clostridium facile]PWM98443.1 MAG: Hsp20/alpha crystallin family protein [Massilioclostridium sp.]
MFELTPFEQESQSFYQYLEQNLFDLVGLSHYHTKIQETEKTYEIQIELPGFEKEDISITIQQNKMVIEAKQHKLIQEQTADYHTSKNESRAFVRSFDVSNVETDQITVDYRQGLLRLSLPKKEPSSIPIKKIEL